ncbi:NAD-dependent DNA ligase LigA [Mycoplasmopsis opalescens]|uniref:NAD-dependent DNA ligase LigA n=1 Tax=Mycoplasmopsis opalescens TaxID=114886 RepID=UPI0004A71FE8|nr:NAD-dependent DNA ligase LigA [Mycoplasmopsis opalescens]
MNRNEAQKRIKTLNVLINKYNREYYIDDNPSISDNEYDKLLLELENLEKIYPEFALRQSTNEVGAGKLIWDQKFSKFVHAYPMLSLAKAYNYDEVERFVNNIENSVPLDEINFILEPKIDGLSIALHYNKGFLVKAVTRGNGVEGEDVTENIFMLQDVKNKIAFDKKIEIRGEIYLAKDRFEELNEQLIKEGKKPFANPRNAASGTLRQLDASVVLDRGLSLFLYQVVNPLEYGLKTQKEVLNFIENMGLPTTKVAKVVEIENLSNEIENFAEVKDNFNYAVDGLVIKLNSLKYHDELGRTAKFPKHSIAFKYDVENAVSTIKNIIATVGRTGKITYVAQLEPVELNQTTVRAATLHNYEFIKKHNINIGDEVKIVKAGEIIPKVIELVNKNSQNTYATVELCPSCNQKIFYIGDNVDQFCINKQCPEMIINKLAHFTMRNSLNIVGLGLSTIKDFYRNGLIKNILDIFELKNKKAEILKLPRFANKKVENLLKNIENSKNTPFFRVLYALGIRHIGLRASKIISTKFSNFTQLLEADNLGNIAKLQNIGETIFTSLTEYLKNDENRYNIAILDTIFNFKKTTNALKSNKFENLTFVITGKLSQPREYFAELIENNGGKVSNSVSKKTSYLLFGEDSGSKLSKANELSIKIINEEQLLELLK